MLQALIEVQENAAIKILKEKEEIGYIARTCHGKDWSGIDGHKSNDFKIQPRCNICLEAGRKNINHYIGTDI